MAKSSKLHTEQFAKAQPHPHSQTRAARWCPARSPTSVTGGMQEGDHSFQKPALGVGNNIGAFFDERMHYYQSFI